MRTDLRQGYLLRAVAIETGEHLIRSQATPEHQARWRRKAVRERVLPRKQHWRHDLPATCLDLLRDPILTDLLGGIRVGSHVVENLPAPDGHEVIEHRERHALLRQFDELGRRQPVARTRGRGASDDFVCRDALARKSNELLQRQGGYRLRRSRPQ